MKKVLLIIYAGKETHEGMGRVVNALVMAKELKEKGHEVKIIFDGAGTEWVPELEKEDNKMNPIYKDLKENVVGICDFCSAAFKAKDLLKEDAPLSGEFMGHPTMAKYFEEDYKILTF